jgi:hypothetical protein
MEFPLIDNTKQLLEEIQQLMIDTPCNKLLLTKKMKKHEYSTYIWNNISSREDLIKSSIFRQNDAVFINYPILKLFAIPEIYGSIVQYLVEIVSDILRTNTTYNIHINIESFTISAAERYSELITTAFRNLFTDVYIQPLDKMYIYNVPSVIDYLKTMFRGLMRGDSLLDEKIVLLR